MITRKAWKLRRTKWDWVDRTDDHTPVLCVEELEKHFPALTGAAVIEAMLHRKPQCPVKAFSGKQYLVQVDTKLFTVWTLAKTRFNRWLYLDRFSFRFRQVHRAVREALTEMFVDPAAQDFSALYTSHTVFITIRVIAYKGSF